MLVEPRIVATSLPPAHRIWSSSSMLRPDDLRLRYLAVLAAMTPGCGPTRDVPPPETTTTSTPSASSEGKTVDVPRVAPEPTASAVASAPQAEPSALPPSTITPPSSSDDVVRRDMGGNWWTLSGGAIEKAHDPSFKPTVPADIDNPRRHVCQHDFMCTRAPQTVSGKAAPAPNATCDVEARPATMSRTRQVYVAFSPGVTSFERKVEATACCYRWNEMDCGRGRPLRDATFATIVAEVTPRDGWTREERRVRDCTLADETRRALAAHWAREGAMEHASVASFSVAALELLSLGAPSNLVAEAHRAALDEIDHARRAFDLAARYDGAAVGPGPLDVKRHTVADDVATITRKTLRDACVDETVAALSAAAAGARATDAMVVETLEVIAADESRHAELGWKTLAWLCATFGERATRVVGQELASLRRALEAPGTAHDEGDAALGDHGVIGEATLARVRHDAISKVVLPCLASLADEPQLQKPPPPPPIR